MATPPTHRRSPTAAAGAEEAHRDHRTDERPPAGRAAAAVGRPAAPRRYINRRIRTQVLILAVVALIMLGLLVVEVARGTLGPVWALGGLLAGGAIGVVASRIKRLEWDDQASQVVSRLDWLGAVILAGFLVTMLARDWVLGHWVEGPALATLGLSVTAGVMAGRALGTRRGARAVLRAVGLLTPANLAAGPDQPQPGSDASTGQGDRQAPDDAAAEHPGGRPRPVDASGAAPPHTPAS